MRHSESERNRTKAWHHADALRDELEEIAVDLMRLEDKVRYALGRTYKMLNRLQSEREADRG